MIVPSICYTYCLTLLFLIGSAGNLLNPIDGVYENQKAKVKVQVELTTNGMRAKRLGQDQWYDYEQIRPGQYRDGQGNTYYLLEENQIEWEGPEGKKRIRFVKSDGALSDDTSSPKQGNTYVHRNHFITNRQFVSARSLRGRWINPSTGQSISIRASRSGKMEVRGSQTRWITFQRSDGNTFRDRKNNRYHFDKGTLTYTSREGDFMMRFERS